ncbi:MAG: hypothetical protein JXX29_11135 [Deltaproteobacteria bacterium]|nr:hypothetical protein [Deltaproteobacteria bacterium]MBN2672224.1 hypothetical protein [Deltaproteobacteria bacterium]
MKKRRYYKFAASCAALLLNVSCAADEVEVGVECDPPPDLPLYNTALLASDDNAIDVNIEVGAAECKTEVCLNITQVNPDADYQRKDNCFNDPTTENCDAVTENGGAEVLAEPVLLNFTFCSCRCEDGDGNRYSDNPDKYDYLCECPPSTVCKPVLNQLTTAVSGIAGAYCVPRCIDEPCVTTDGTNEHLGEVCTPSSSSEEPWKWNCETL